jgi:hypothetical protein
MAQNHPSEYVQTGLDNSQVVGNVSIDQSIYKADIIFQVPPSISKDKTVNSLSLSLNVSIEIDNDITLFDEINGILDSTENHLRKQITSTTKVNSLSIQKKHKKNTK